MYPGYIRWAFVWPSFLLFLASISLTAWGQSFTVSATPQALTIHPGDQNVPLNVSVAGDGSYSGRVTVTLTGLPSGITVSPLTVDTGSSGMLVLNADVSASQESFPASAAGETDTSQSTITLVAAAGSVIVTTPITLTVSLENSSYAPSPGQINLPVVTIDTGGVAIADNTTDIPGTITITSADGHTSYLPNASDSDNTATFHLHGDTTAVMPKKPYHVKLNTSVDLLGAMGLVCPYVTGSGKATCDKSKSYILLANYDDKTLLRDWAASALANAIPLGGGYLESPAGSPSPSGTSALMPWAPHSLFVELYLNGVYEGNYQLIEEVKVDSHRVNITELSDTDTGDLSGGYLLEIDQRRSEDFNFETPSGFSIGLVDPDFTPEVPEQTSYISSYVDAADTALFSGNFTDPTLGWRAYFDEASAINFYIVNDVMGNVDGGAFFSSDYLYKDKDNPLLYMGPIWDFDISSGNTNYQPIVSPGVPWMQVEAPWYVRWFSDPGFKADLVKQWNTLKNNGVFDAWLASISQEASTLEQSQANNFGRWPMQGIMVWPNPEAAGSYDGELAYLTNWLRMRIAYLDSQFNPKAATSVAMNLPGGTMQIGTPFTLAAQVAGGKAPTGTVAFLANNVLAGTAALDPGGNASLMVSKLPLPSASVSAIYSGDGNNSLSVSPQVPVSVLPQLISTVTSLSVPGSPVNADEAVNFTASVLTNSGSQSPSGTISLLSDNVPIGTSPLSAAGAATFSSSSLPGGSHSIQAVYSGDSTYQSSTSVPATISVTPIGYSLALNPMSLRVKRGQSMEIALTLTPQNGYSGNIALSCSGLPANTSCIFGQGGGLRDITVSSASTNDPVTLAVTIQTDITSASLQPPEPAPLFPAIALWCPAGLAIFGRKYRRRSRRTGAVCLFLLFFGLIAGLLGCSSVANSTPEGNYTVAITASPAQGAPAAVPQTVNLDLTVVP